jgi:hypothetical protein
MPIDICNPAWQEVNNKILGNTIKPIKW